MYVSSTALCSAWICLALQWLMESMLQHQQVLTKSKLLPHIDHKISDLRLNPNTTNNFYSIGWSMIFTQKDAYKATLLITSARYVTTSDWQSAADQEKSWVSATSVQWLASIIRIPTCSWLVAPQKSGQIWIMGPLKVGWVSNIQYRSKEMWGKCIYLEQVTQIYWFAIVQL